MDPRGGCAVLAQKHIMTQTFFCIVFDNKFLRGCLHEKTGTGASSYQDDFLISYHFYIMTEPFHILLCEGTLHVDRIHV